MHIDVKPMLMPYLPPNNTDAWSGSKRTPQEYARLLARFFGPLGKAPPEVSPADVHTFAYSVSDSGKEPSAGTVAVRLAAVSSFFQFCLRMGLLDFNPASRVQRPRVEPPSPRGLSPPEIKRLLQAIPATPAGIRDRAIVLLMLYMGLRRAEAMNLTAGDVSREGQSAYLNWRAKGGRLRRREIPEPVYAAIEMALVARGLSLGRMAPSDPLWNVSGQGIYLNLRRYLRKARLPETGLHVLRHTSAKLRRQAGDSIEDVSALLGHRDIAITARYLARMEGDGDSSWEKVAALLE